MMRRLKWIAVGALLGLGTLTLTGRAEDAPDPRAAQVRAGAQVFSLVCAMCHGDRLEGVGGPSLSDSAFRAFYEGTTVHGIYNRVRDEMPLDRPGSLTDQEALDVVAYVLRANGVPLPDGGVRADTLDAPVHFAAAPQEDAANPAERAAP
ncbi:c-type cytochrome [Deinococcus maricopensis]|uniref:Cytochrome c class I n=1 Tax=Deinococcus maricopensis (strain DSM 21211 / LMG 22137 / NRRL B-23946 / LB-34) TaxID=709986 RepID=E8U537_DEIML|nr:cytochrome c [Deinococcus maricopensis]ADV66176.1 cytochrome c class I [Deinococcus maricopensis DSM 21211]